MKLGLVHRPEGIVFVQNGLKINGFFLTQETIDKVTMKKLSEAIQLKLKCVTGTDIKPVLILRLIIKKILAQRPFIEKIK